MSTRAKNVSAKAYLNQITGAITFGEMLSALRKSQELTQVKFSQKLHISKQELCNIEKGRKCVSLDRAISFAQLLGMPQKTFAKYALQDQLMRAGLSGVVVIKEVA